MPGSLIMEGHLDLTETDVPGDGEPVTIKLKNNGTIDLASVSIQLTGKGAHHVELAEREGLWQEAGKSLSFPVLKKGVEIEFYARATYSQDDAEDREKFELIATALSVG